jgi:signal transduction histidine kinase
MVKFKWPVKVTSSFRPGSAYTMGFFGLESPNLWAALGVGAIVAAVVFWGSWQQHALKRERRRTADTARRAEAMLRSMPGGYLAWEKGGRFICSDKVLSALGVTRGVATFSDLNPDGGILSADDFARLEEAVTAFLADATPFRERIATADGAHVFEITSAERKGVADDAISHIAWLRDVSEDARDRARLAKVSAERDDLKSLLDAAPFPIWLRNKSLSLHWANRAYIAAVEADGLTTVLDENRELSPPGHLDSPYEIAAEAQTEDKIFSREQSMVIGGERRLMDITSVPIARDPGDAAAIASFAIDHTEMSDLRNELSRHRTAHNETLDELSTAVAIFNPDHRLAFFNRAYARLWQLPDDWLASEPSHEEIIEVLREKRRLPEQSDFRAWKQAQLNLYSRLIEPSEELWYLPDGSMLRVVAQPHPLGGLLFLFEDVTDRIALETSYNTLIQVQRVSLDRLFEGVAVFGSDGTTRLHNAAFARIWGLDSAMLGAHPHIRDVLDKCSERIPEPDREAILGHALGGDDERRPAQARLTCPDGRAIDYTFVPLPDGATLHTFLDVTDSVEVERALRERADALETADRLKTEFVANVSYQLRTPLSNIIGFTEMLENEYYGQLNREQHDYTSGILASSHHLAALIDNILDLAMIEAGRLELALERFDLVPFMDSVAAIAREQARPKQISVVLTYPSDIGEIVADERRLKQVLFNLVSNAVQYTPAGGEVSIAASRRNTDPDSIEFCVTDTGPGIPNEESSVVFEAFRKGSAGGNGTGPGLGLSLVRNFVQLHGGAVTLESGDGQGTRVTCVVPATGEAAANPDLAKSQREMRSA